MKKLFKQFSRTIVVAGVTIPVLFVAGCQNSPTDIDDLEQRVARLESTVETLDQKLAAGFMIESIDELPDRSGWRITFVENSSGERREAITITHGADGRTPLVEVRTNPDGTTSIWIDSGDGFEDSGIDLTGAAGATPEIEVRTADGKTTIWYNVGEGWVDTGVDIGAPASANPVLAIVENADGTVTFTMNDGQGTKYTFARYSTAQGLEVTTTEAIEVAGAGTAAIVFRVNPSTAWIPTGTGEAITKWALDELGTRASYVNPSKVFKIESITSDGDRKGQYIAAVSCDIAMHDFDTIDEYDMMLVLNNNKSADEADDSFVSSGAFKMKITATPPAIVAEGDLGETLHWTLTEDGTFTLRGTGNMPSYTSTSTPWHSLKGDIKRVIIMEGVTSVGPNAFHTCPNLAEVTLPESLTLIDQYGFYACASLTGFTIPANVTKLGNNVFQNCTGLAAIVIPNGVTSIGTNLFNGCAALAGVTIGSGVTTLNSFAFANCKALTEITIPGTVLTTGTYTFQGCSNLTSVTLGNGIETIGNNTFDGCPFTAITIPGSVKTLGNNAFIGSGLTSITIPASVTTIGNSTFRRNAALTAITIPDTVTSLGNNVFQDCTSLGSVVISGNVPNLGTSVFQGCTALMNVIIPNSVTNIAASAFNGCTGLVSVVIGSGVTNIANMAFNDCPLLTKVTINTATPPTLGTPSNFAADGDTLYVPAGSAATYAGTNWNDAFTTITEAEQRALFTYLLAADWWPDDYIGGRQGVNSISMRIMTDAAANVAKYPMFYDLQLLFDCPPIDMSDYFLTIPNGTYNVSSTGGLQTIYAGNSAIQPWVNGVRGSILNISSGKVVVSGNHNHCTMAIDLVLSDGEEFHADFVGPLKIKNPHKPVYSTFTEAQSMGALSMTNLIYFADALDNGTIDAYRFHATTSGITANNDGTYSGTGWVFTTELHTTPNSGGTIPDFTYSFADDTEVRPGYALSGYKYQGITRVGSWACYYVNDVITKEGPMNTGTLTVARSGSAYTMTLAGVDDALTPNNVTGTITGSPTVSIGQK